MLSSRNRALLASLLGASVVVAACEDRNEPDGATTSTGTGASGPGGGGQGGGVVEGPAIPGLEGEVTALYDQTGLLHLTCATDDDCYAALGYFHAQNRFFFMDFVRNLVRGKLGALVRAGDTVLAQDFENRRFFTTPQGDPLETALYESASPRVQGHMDAYTRGVNAWIGDMREARNGATLTTEYDFALIVKEAIRDWEPEDSAAVGLYVLNDLSNNSDAELAMAQALPAFDAPLAADLYSARPVFDAFTVPPATAAPAGVLPLQAAHLAPSRALFADARARLALVGSGASSRTPGETGSNNWVVAPDRTSGGRALLANDPHLSLTNPSIWFPVELDAKSQGDGEYHVAGSTFPGLPAVMVGHNETVAWGVTTAYYDLADVYLEELSEDGSAVLFDGDEVPIIEKTFSFEDSDSGQDVERTFRYVPHHGPIVSEDLDAGTAVSIKWVGHRAGTDLDAFFGVARAATREEARVAIESASSANQNFVIIDEAGDIGWFPYGELPIRPFAATSAPWLPLPGDGSAEWDGFVAIEDLPQLDNPATGVIATANQDMTGVSADGDLLDEGQPALQAHDKADGTRQQRILDLLEAGGSDHDVDSMVAMQGDTFSLYGELVVPAVLAAAASATLDADEQTLFDALESWAYTCPTGLASSDPEGAVDPDATATAESIGCTAFHATFYALVSEALKDEIADAGVTPSSGRRITLIARALRDPGALVSGGSFWDDTSTVETETRDDMLVRALRVAAARLAFMGAPDEWRWGRVHTLSLRSIFDNFGVPTYNAPAVAAPGGLFTVNVANPSSAVPAQDSPWNMGFTAGASVRFVVEATADGMRMVYQLPGGTDLHRESPFYNQLLEGYLVNEPIPFPFGPGAVEDPAITVVVSPAP